MITTVLRYQIVLMDVPDALVMWSKKKRLNLIEPLFVYYKG